MFDALEYYLDSLNSKFFHLFHFNVFSTYIIFLSQAITVQSRGGYVSDRVSTAPRLQYSCASIWSRLQQPVLLTKPAAVFKSHPCQTPLPQSHSGTESSTYILWLGKNSCHWKVSILEHVHYILTNVHNYPD